jgi:predicted ATPase
VPGSHLPSGAVTFLFTDIEGSTRLIEALGEEGYVDALAEHRHLLRSAFSTYGGVEVDTQGDAFLYAFGDPRGALAAAEQGQSALVDGPVKVRMGLHTGETVRTEEGYAGRELHRAARIAASGHGGQVVLSSATRVLVDGDVTELGEHRLKDFDEPVMLFQLGSERFPPLKTISNTNLPRAASSFVGRQRERDELVSMLSNGARLVTLSGPGGSGKTRLALEAATELVPDFKAGVFWIGLSALRDPALVTETIGQTLGSKNGLAEHVGERQMLLLLDNFEQVVAAAPHLGQLLESCANLKLLVTSRELLRIQGEVDYPVLPMAEAEAVELFCTRAQLDPDETITDLCRSLDELPLALELAAARTRVLSPAQILERLSERLDLLKGGRDTEARQQTLRAAIEWSHDLLEDEEQRLFARLAVFRGGCRAEAAEQVAGADLDTLQSLVDKSLLRHTNERFWMLETIREFAREQLTKAPDEAQLRRRHALAALDFAEGIVRHLEAGGDQGETYARMGSELDNLRSALEWMRDARENEALLRLVAALGQYLPRSGFYEEADTWNALALERSAAPVEARMVVLRSAAMRASLSGDAERADALVAEWRAIAEKTGDASQVLRAMNSAAMNALDRGDLKEAREQLTAVGQHASSIDDTMMVAFTTINLGEVELRSRDFGSALEYSARAVELFRELGDDGGVATALESCGWAVLHQSDPVRAEECFQEMLDICGRLGWVRGTGAAAVGVGIALIARHQAGRGVQLLAAAASLREDLGVGLEEHEEQAHETALADARAELGDEAFSAVWARGAAMTPEGIVAFTMPA